MTTTLSHLGAVLGRKSSLLRLLADPSALNACFFGCRTLRIVKGAGFDLASFCDWFGAGTYSAFPSFWPAKSSACLATAGALTLSVIP